MDISPELNELFTTLLGSEKDLLLAQIGKKLDHTIRFNPLKCDIETQKTFFLEQGFRFHPVEGLDNVYQIDYQPYAIGRSLSHFLGHIYVQEIASMIPPMVMGVQPGDWVLDMSAAPGSKTTQLGALMGGSGVLLGNDIVSARIKALGWNITRWGLSNAFIYKRYGEQFGNLYFETFDHILLDPACSGLGTLHKNPEVLGWWSEKHCERLAESQQKLIMSAIKALKPGGTLTYSTCTLAPQENEAIVDFALKNFPVEVVPIELPGMRTWPGLTSYNGSTYDDQVEGTIRLYPTERVSEGFYVSRLRKTGGMRSPHPSKFKPPRHMGFLSHRTSPVKKYLDHLSGQFDIPRDIFKQYVYLMGKSINFIHKDMSMFPFHGMPLQIGISAASFMKHGARLSTEGVQLLGRHARNNVIELETPEMLERFVNREPLGLETDARGQVIVRYKGMEIGYCIADKGVLKSQFPKADWPFTVVVNNS